MCSISKLTLGRTGNRKYEVVDWMEVFWRWEGKVNSTVTAGVICSEVSLFIMTVQGLQLI